MRGVDFLFASRFTDATKASDLLNARYTPMALLRAQIAVVLTAITIAAGCRPTIKSTPETRALVSSAPSWYNSPPKSSEYLYSAVTAESQDMQLAVDKAKAAGRAELAQQLSVKFDGIAKRFQEESGLGKQAELVDQFNQTYKLVVSQEMSGSRMKDQKVLPGEGVYRAYVLMEIPAGDANKALMAKLSAQEALYTRFRATQAFKELNDEIERASKAGKP
jgi:hypothetical protein